MYTAWKRCNNDPIIYPKFPTIGALALGSQLDFVSHPTTNLPLERVFPKIPPNHWHDMQLHPFVFPCDPDWRLA